MFKKRRDELIIKLLNYYIKILKPWGETYGCRCSEGEISLNSIPIPKVQCYLILTLEDSFIEVKIENGEIINIVSIISCYATDDVKEKIELTKKYLEDHAGEIESAMKTSLVNKILKYNLN